MNIYVNKGRRLNKNEVSNQGLCLPVVPWRYCRVVGKFKHQFILVVCITFMQTAKNVDVSISIIDT